ncbi:Eco57I restriction-modification methylase domain-containing protein [Winogradskyella forsetii]|uniref:Eco57I restriction-modification methylase domain-containing protein n=1 Tax=Winogradskyella forsetii TaxID=2686077 RepID=UPI0015CDFB1A
MQDSKKNTGSYYTPSFLADFVSKRVLTYFESRKRISILEPSVGDGAFVDSLKSFQDLSIKLDAVDINANELKKAAIRWKKRNSNFKEIDFLEFNPKRHYSAVIGNPPYVKKNILSDEQIEMSKEIHNQAKLSEATSKNIWVTFLIKSIGLLQKNGVLAFVLPSELLQVQFAEEIREYLKKEFDRIEIFTFNDLMFECKGQDTIVLFAYKKHIIKGEFFANIENQKNLEDESFILRKNDILIESKVKWTHHFLSSDELIFLENIKNSLKLVSDYSDSKPGIVTAANKFFIIDKETEAKYSLEDYTKPIIQKGFFVNGSVVFNKKDFLDLEKSNRPTRLLQLNNDDEITESLRQYLEIGQNQDIPERYKCRKRNNWYVIPNISKKPKGLFFKRSHLYPKILKNTSEAFVTDSAYKIEMKEGYNLESFIYSFYNSLTLLFSETNGRYYGGGVLELTPSEFKGLPLPYMKVDKNEFNKYVKTFEAKQKIEDILDINDFKILNTSLGLDLDSIARIKKIRQKLLSKRLRS